MASLKIRLAAVLRRHPRLRMYVDVARFLTSIGKGPAYDCPLCDFHGRFMPFGSPPRPGAMCPSCGAVERQRLIALYFRRDGGSLSNLNVLHFAPELSIQKMVKAAGPTRYLTADINEGRADRVLNIEQLDLADGEFDLVICNHVLEHVDDGKALKELFRILKPGGRAIITTPMVDAWDESYEPAHVNDADGRLLHFGQSDHVRIFGRDLRDRIERAGFKVAKFIAGGEDSVTYGLLRGETVFVSHKLDRASPQS